MNFRNKELWNLKVYYFSCVERFATLLLSISYLVTPDWSRKEVDTVLYNKCSEGCLHFWSFSSVSGGLCLFTLKVKTDGSWWCGNAAAFLDTSCRRSCSSPRGTCPASAAPCHTPWTLDYRISTAYSPWRYHSHCLPARYQRLVVTEEYTFLVVLILLIWPASLYQILSEIYTQSQYLDYTDGDSRVQFRKSILNQITCFLSLLIIIRVYTF